MALGSAEALELSSSPGGQEDEARSLNDLRDVVGIVEVHLLPRTLRGLQAAQVAEDILSFSSPQLPLD